MSKKNIFIVLLILVLAGIGFFIYKKRKNVSGLGKLTPFQDAVKSIKDGKLKAPSVNYHGKDVDYIFYQLVNHRAILKLLSVGLKQRGANLSTYKKYYGLTGRSAKDCLVQLEQIINDYKKENGIG